MFTACAGRPVFIVAEISANHAQRLDRAIALIRAAKKCGVDAVKFQAYTPDTMTLPVNNKYFMITHPKWGGQTLYELYKKAETPWRWFKALKKVADDLGLLFFATAFDKTSVDFLEEIDVPFHKIASFELVDVPLIEYAARTKKPLIISTGMATMSEIKGAVSTAKRAGARQVVLLKCVSSYPARPGEMNLLTIPDMHKRFALPVGLSDHTLGVDVSIAAVCLGAVMVEKHFTMSRTRKTPDAFFSTEPAELKNLVRTIRTVEEALGSVRYGPTADEKKLRIFRRSLFTLRDIARGEVLTDENIGSIRPAYGLAPKYLKKVLGRKARTAITKGVPVRWGMLT